MMTPTKGRLGRYIASVRFAALTLCAAVFILGAALKGDYV